MGGRVVVGCESNLVATVIESLEVVQTEGRNIRDWLSIQPRGRSPNVSKEVAGLVGVIGMQPEKRGWAWG
jgi:hypothetical protein